MRFSKPELLDLLKAWILVAAVFSLATRGTSFDGFWILFVESLGVVGIAFILHELAHKFTAQRYGLQAEFRSFDGMAVFSLILSFFGVIFLAPGAVMIRGGDRIRMGRIAAAGPIVNIVLAVLFLGAFFIYPLSLFQFAFFINSFLALFNMLPFFVLDGRKVLSWNRGVFGVLIGILGLLVVLSSVI